MSKHRRDMSNEEIRKLPEGWVGDGMAIGIQSRFNNERERAVLLLSKNNKSHDDISKITGLNLKVIDEIIHPK